MNIRPSSVGTWIMCGMKWYYGHIERIRTPGSTATVLGSSMHLAIEVNSKQKLKTKKEMKLQDMFDVFDEYFNVHIKEITLQDGGAADKAINIGHAMIAKYHKVYAPLVMPKYIELPIKASIKQDGIVVNISGTLDLIDENDVLIDYKTKKQRTSVPAGDHVIQLGLYKIGANQNKIKVKKMRMDYLIKNKNCDLIQLPVPMAQSQAVAKKVVLDMAKSAQAGIFHANPTGWWCSEKYCGYHKKAGGPCKYGL